MELLTVKAVCGGIRGRKVHCPTQGLTCLELMSSSDIIVSNIVFQDLPFWNIHPVYCSNVVIRNVTVLAPHDSPNTDGIDPDSSSNVCIEDCYISTRERIKF